MLGLYKLQPSNKFDVSLRDTFEMFWIAIDVLVCYLVLQLYKLLLKLALVIMTS